MTGYYDRDDARRRLVITLQGAFQTADVLAAIERQRVEDTWSYGLLYDLRGVTGHPTIEDLKQILSQVTLVEQPRGPVAFLVTDPILYGMLCKYAALGRSKLTVVEVFRDRDDADRWLFAHAIDYRSHYGNH